MKNDMYPPLMIIKSHDILFLKKTQIKCAFERFWKVCKKVQFYDNQNKTRGTVRKLTIDTPR